MSVTVNGDHVEFRFFRPTAGRVYLTGDFNAWRHEDLAMTCNDGYWYAELLLAPGEYRFHYVADGQRFADYAAFGVEPGPFGLDSVLRITSSTTERALSNDELRELDEFLNSALTSRLAELRRSRDIKAKDCVNRNVQLIKRVLKVVRTAGQVPQPA